jgi:hypothetical protein
MEILKAVAKFAAENPVLVLAALALVAVAIGKGKEFTAILEHVQNTAEYLEGMIARTPDVETRAAKYYDALSVITGATKLTTDQAQSVITRDAKTNEIVVNKKNLVLAVLQSGDGRKVQRKVRMWFQKKVLGKKD